MLPDRAQTCRDPEGRILRQAARFRLFGLNSGGEIIQELSSNDGEIHWKVHVANRKAAWYFFAKALDLAESTGANYSDTGGTPAVACPRRNLQCTGVERNRLSIDPGPRLISGNNSNADGSEKEYAFDTGTFFDQPVYLGEVRTDACGNLIFLGGKGHSTTVIAGPPPGFANNPGWHDDTSDGPVDASIKLKDRRSFEATGSWVITAPPDYAPGIRAFVTGYDLLLDVAIRLDPSLRPPRVRFYEHVYPILERVSLCQWVNAGLALQFGYGCPTDFTDPDLMRRLSDPGDDARPLRQLIFQSFRDANYKVMDAKRLASRSSSLAMMPGGPLDGSVAGSLSRWMACPWQTDTASCLSAYKAYAGEYLPTFWPARVPNDVVTEEAYKIIMDRISSLAEKEKAFNIVSRKKWLRGIVYNNDSPPSKISAPNSRQVFVDHWPEVGIVVRMPGPANPAICPKDLWVETGRTFPGSVSNAVAETLPSWMRSLLSQR